MARGVQEFYAYVADTQVVAGLHPYQIVVGNAGDFFDAVGFGFVCVYLDRVGSEKLSNAVDGVAAERAADVIGMIMGDPGGGEYVVLRGVVLLQAFGIPRRVDD